MITTLRLICIAILISCLTTARADDTRELYLIRIVNQENGPISVSCDGGNTYLQVGKVLHPATTTTPGYLASIYAKDNTVAATAVHGIRIRLATSNVSHSKTPYTMSILPLEFAQTPKGFGGYNAGLSGICTNIRTGTGIFRNLAPFVGNKVYLETNGQYYTPSEGYKPTNGAVFVIVVSLPARYPNDIVFENKLGGNVIAVYQDGKETIARVEHPVTGIGRYDATGYTGVGRINTNHTGVITISTAPIVSGGKDGSGTETRGGFMVQPSRHAKDVAIMPQILVVGPATKESSWLEGTEPLFSGYISLADNFKVDVKTAKSDDWISLPPMIGRNDSALQKLPGGPMTHIRLSFPKYDAEWIRAEAQKCNRAYLDACLSEARKNGSLAIGDSISFDIITSGLKDIQHVSFYVDGELKSVSNSPPYKFTVSTKGLAEGEHIAEINAVDSSGAVARRIRKTFFVQ